MKQDLIKDVIQGMLPYLNNAQNEKLQEVLQYTLAKYEVAEKQNQENNSEQNYVELFLSAKRIEGCSEKSLKYYKATIEAMLDELNKDVKHIVTDDIRGYLTEYQEKKKSSKVTIDNIRRILSSFFSWLEDEDYILKSPVRRIHRVKTGTNIKETYSDEALELMRDNCTELRDLAIIDMLASTGMRVGEMVLLNRNNIDFNERECIVFGKGSKERVVYFDARTKIHLQNYLESRTDDNPALFVSLKSPHERLKIGGVEVRLREFGKQLGLQKVHPHKFRRTLATMAIDKGMPIEQLQQLLGHRKMPFLRFREEGQHYGYELFLSPPKHWGSRGAPLWWAYAARKFTYDKLPMDEQFFYEKYKSIVQEFGMKIYSNHLRSVYKELHADRETGC